jgi:hypothetical protein
MIAIRLAICLLVACLMTGGCVYTPRIPREEILAVYRAQGESGSPLSRFAPVFLVHAHRDVQNKIGTPEARREKDGAERIHVNPDLPVIYHATTRFTTERGAFTNLVYRVHFPEVPFSLVPFHLTAGRNVGLLVIVTLDESRRLVLVTTAGTCGCYAATVPTGYLPRDARPEGWPESGRVFVYGESLPSVLNLDEVTDPLILVALRPDVHRVMDIRVAGEAEIADPRRYRVVEAPLRRAEDLEKLPLNGETTSFYHRDGVLRGHVKGSIKLWETLFMSLISLDLFVGADKVYGDSRVTGNPFYTSLKPWNREASDMWDFGRYLRFNGWRL